MTVFKRWLACICSEMLSTHSGWPFVCAINLWNPDLFSSTQNCASNLISILSYSDSLVKLLIEVFFAPKLKSCLQIFIELKSKVFLKSLVHIKVLKRKWIWILNQFRQSKAWKMSFFPSLCLWFNIGKLQIGQLQKRTWLNYLFLYEFLITSG